MLRDYDVKTFRRICDQVCATGGAETDEASEERDRGRDTTSVGSKRLGWRKNMWW